MCVGFLAPYCLAFSTVLFVKARPFFCHVSSLPHLQTLVQVSTSVAKTGGTFLQFTLTFLSLRSSQTGPDIDRPVVFTDNGPGTIFHPSGSCTSP
jgi:hypothetical protein